MSRVLDLVRWNRDEAGVTKPAVTKPVGATTLAGATTKQPPRETRG
jgi:hypothetical protein